MKKVLGLCAVLIMFSVLFVATSSAVAGLIDGFSGWTQMSDCAYCDAIVNFSVYQAVDSNWTDDPFFSNVSSMVNQYNTLDTSAQYIYMYQIVNKDPDTNALSDDPVYKFDVRYHSAFTSGGYFDNIVFNDGTGQISAANWSLSNPDPSFPGDDYISTVTGLGDGQPSSTVSVSNISLVSDSGVAKDPVEIINTAGACPSAGADCWILGWSWGLSSNHIQTNKYSPVLFATSNTAPQYAFGETESFGGSGADGEIPTTLPEPVSTILFIIGGAILGLRQFWKIQKV